MTKSKSKRAIPATPATLPPVDSGPTEDQIRAERIAEIKQLPYFELTERIGDDGLPVVGSWSLPNWVAHSIHLGQSPVRGVCSPWEESVILVPDQIGGFGRIRLLPAPPLTAEQERNVLAKKIEKLSETIPLASIQMVQLADPRFEGRIGAYPSDFPVPYDSPRKWPIEGVRPLWEQSVQYISGATFTPNEADGGFVTWLWTKVQKLWGIRKVEGLAVDPYGIWLKALTRHPNAISMPYSDPVASNPQNATAEEILRVAEHAKGLARGSIKTKRIMAEESRLLHDSVNALHRLRTAPPEGLTPQELQHRIWQAESDEKQKTHMYRWSYRHWLTLEQWHKVVESYEIFYVPEIAAQRPPLANLDDPLLGIRPDYEALSPHLNRVAVELANVANTKATKDTTTHEWIIDSKQNWCKRLDWSAQTQRNRRAKFPDCFKGDIHGKSCSIRDDMVTLWTAVAGNKSS